MFSNWLLFRYIKTIHFLCVNFIFCYFLNLILFGLFLKLILWGFPNVLQYYLQRKSPVLMSVIDFSCPILSANTPPPIHCQIIQWASLLCSLPYWKHFSFFSIKRLVLGLSYIYLINKVSKDKTEENYFSINLTSKTKICYFPVWKSMTAT